MKRKKKLILCQEAVGFLTQCTRPDISFAVSAVSRYCSNPGKSHWTAVRKSFRYLKATNYDDDWRSCAGFAFTLQGAAISWSSKRQPTI